MTSPKMDIFPPNYVMKNFVKTMYSINFLVDFNHMDLQRQQRRRLRHLLPPRRRCHTTGASELYTSHTTKASSVRPYLHGQT